MSSVLYIASDAPLPEVPDPHEDEGFIFDGDRHCILDGGYDDRFSILPLHPSAEDIWTEKAYRSELTWLYWTAGRAERVIAYLREQLERTDEVELWHGWMGCETRPAVRTCTIPIHGLKPEDIRDLEETPVSWEDSVHYRLVITGGEKGERQSP